MKTIGALLKTNSAASRHRLWLAVGIALASFATYLPALHNAFILWDDDKYIIDNHHIQQFDWTLVQWVFSSTVQGNWHPLTMLSHAVDYAVWGLNPFGHHLTSLLIHGLNTFLVVILVIQLLQCRHDRAIPESLPPAAGRDLLIAGAITGLLFGIHPLHVESVAWASERKDLLCGLFYLLAVLSHVTCQRKAAAEADTHSGFVGGFCWPTAVFSLLALLSKPMAVTIPLVLLLLDWYPLQRFGSVPKFFRCCSEKLPLLAMSAVFAGVTIFAQKSGTTEGYAELVPLWGRLLVAARSYTVYLAKMVAPVGLSPFYPYPQLQEIMPFSLSYLLPVLLFGGLSLFLLRHFRNHKGLLAVWGYYVMTLLPVIGIIQMGDQSMADRYSYLPSVGPFCLAGVVSAGLWRRMAGRSASRGLMLTAGFLATVALVWSTQRQIAVWKNSVTFWSTIIDREPVRVPFAYINRGLAYKQAGELRLALDDLNRAVELVPNNFKSFNNRGLVLLEKGEVAPAIHDFDRAIALAPNDNNAYFNRGLALRKKREPVAALADFDRAIALNPEDIRARNNKGLVLQELGEPDRALAEFTAAIVLVPTAWISFNNRGLLLLEQGDVAGAIADLGRAIRLNGGESSAYINRGLAYRANGDDNRALADFNRAIALNPEDSRSYNNRALILAGQGRLDEAQRDFTQALQLDPSLAAVYLNRGLVRLKAGDESAARLDFAQACARGVKKGCDFLQ